MVLLVEATRSHVRGFVRALGPFAQVAAGWILTIAFVVVAVMTTNRMPLFTFIVFHVGAIPAAVATVSVVRLAFPAAWGQRKRWLMAGLIYLAAGFAYLVAQLLATGTMWDSFLPATWPANLVYEIGCETGIWHCILKG